MITVNVENLGTLQFPDGTSSEVIQKTVKDQIAQKNPKAPDTFSGQVIGQFKRIGQVYSQEAEEGLEAMKEMGAKPTGKNILRGFLGALRYGFSPLTAIAKGAVGEPIEKNLEAAGTPKPIAQFIGALGENAAYFVPYGKMVQTAIQGQKTIQSAKMAQSAMKEVAKKPLEFPKGVSDEAIAKAVSPISETQKAVLTENMVNDVIRAVKKPVSKTWKPLQEKRITQEVIDYIMQNKQEVPKALKKYGYTPEQLAAEMKETMSTSGRQLGQMGKWAKELRKTFDDPEMRKLASFMEKDLPEATTFDKFFAGWKSLENTRRGLLVGQVATSTRNAISQTGRLGIGAVDDALKGAIEGAVSGGTAKETAISTLRGMGEGLDAVQALFGRLKPAQRQKLVDILNTTQAIDTKAKIFSSPVLDVTLGTTLSKTANILNRAQEFFFRHVAFESKLNQLLKKAGVKGGIKGIDPKKIPEEMLGEAANYSLEMTFASVPKSKEAQRIVRGMTHPILTSLLNPFPRFLFGNALPFLKQFSPVGFLEAVSPSTVAELASGNPAKFAKAASRATIGTVMLNAAMYIRNNPELGGEDTRWYEVKVGKGKTLDTRAFAPLSTYLFIAESLTHPEKVKPADFFSALLSLNRIGGTGLVISDIIRGKKAERTVDVVTKIAGEYLGSFTTPVRTLKDLYSGLQDPEEAKIRDIREKEFLGPTIRNIPELSQTLPESKSPLRIGAMKTESPLLRQFTGLSVRTKTTIEKEVEKIDLDSSKIYPRTGIPEGDRAISEIMAPMIDKTIGKFIEFPMYKKAGKPVKRLLLGTYFKNIKTEARKQLMATNPKLAMKIRIERLSDDEEAVIQDITNRRRNK